MSAVVEVKPAGLPGGKPDVTITDPRGRKIVLRRPSVLAEYQFVRMLGKQTESQMYVGMVMPLLFVASVDDVAPSLTTVRQVDALVQQLDRDGIEAVIEGLQEHFAEEANSAEVRDSVKKS